MSKKHPPSAVEALAAAGQTVFGENKVQEAAQKIPACSGHLEWHLVGHLQSNKARLAAALFHTVHSVDSEKLLRLLNQEASRAGRNLAVYLQVNVSGEGAKHGLAPDAVAPVLDAASHCMNLDVLGLMTMPPIAEDPEEAAPHFAALRELRDGLRAQTGFPLERLSMGMSHDCEIAIREGATTVRVGTDLFGKRSAK